MSEIPEQQPNFVVNGTVSLNYLYAFINKFNVTLALAVVCTTFGFMSKGFQNHCELITTDKLVYTGCPRKCIQAWVTLLLCEQSIVKLGVYEDYVEKTAKFDENEKRL